jgi:uncharacterized phage protein (TIGR01671 family)
MREHLYRGKTIEDGEWALGSLMILEMENEKGKQYRAFYIVEEKDNFRVYKNEVVPETVGQFIGLLDIDEKKIFEGDILQGDYNIKALIIWADQGWHPRLYYDGQFEDGYSHIEEITKLKMKLIGNIHDNYELLEAKNDL